MRKAPKGAFGKFIVGESNSRVVEEITQLTSNRIRNSQCIFLKGPHCSGKTLLINCLLNEYRCNFPQANIVIENCETFACKLIDNINQKKLVANLWPSDCDVLVIEDVDFLSGKLATQEILLEMLQQQISKGTLVIITANLNTTFPKAFGSGKFDCVELVIEEPSYMLRSKIIEAKLRKHKIRVKRRILRRMVSSEMTMSQLLGAINSIVFVKTVLKGRITPRLYERISGQYKHDNS